MKTLLVVNGETYWQDYLPDFKVVQKKIQTSEWILKDDKLYVVDEQGVVQPDVILWRVGAIKPLPKHRTILELIQISGVACVNSAKVLLQGYDRLSMLGFLQKCGLPVIPFNAVTTSTHLKNIEMSFTFVVKAGNYHGGYGKVLVDSEEKWQDTKDLLFIADDYVTVEPYIDYVKDIRYLAVGDKVWAMARKGKFWKANVGTIDFKGIDIEEGLFDQTKQLKAHLGADILAIDILEDKNGKRFFVEYNDIPGLSGFPDEVKVELAGCVNSKIDR